MKKIILTTENEEEIIECIKNFKTPDNKPIVSTEEEINKVKHCIPKVKEFILRLKDNYDNKNSTTSKLDDYKQTGGNKMNFEDYKNELITFSSNYLNESQKGGFIDFNSFKDFKLEIPTITIFGTENPTIFDWIFFPIWSMEKSFFGSFYLYL